MKEPDTEGPAFDRFHRAFLAPGLKLLGFQCEPFCLGHLMLFQALGLPFARLGEPDVAVAPSDLLLALRVCETPWPFRLGTRRPLVEEEREQRLWRALSKSPRRFRIVLDVFMDWLVECSMGPEMWHDESGDGRPMSCPVVLGMAVRLLRLGSMGEERVYSMPLALVRSYALAIAEQEGGAARFLTPEDMEAMEQHSKMPDLTQASDEELYEIVKKDRGEDYAKQFLAARKESHGTR